VAVVHIFILHQRNKDRVRQTRPNVLWTSPSSCWWFSADIASSRRLTSRWELGLAFILVRKFKSNQMVTFIKHYSNSRCSQCCTQCSRKQTSLKSNRYHWCWCHMPAEAIWRCHAEWSFSAVTSWSWNTRRLCLMERSDLTGWCIPYTVWGTQMHGQSEFDVWGETNTNHGMSQPCVANIPNQTDVPVRNYSSCPHSLPSNLPLLCWTSIGVNIITTLAV